jgi:hypothetical protein
MALSKDWQLANVRGLLRIFANEVAPDKIQDLTLDDILHLAICDTIEALGEAAYSDYGTKQTVTQTSDVIDISSYGYDTITKLVDATNGLVVEVNPTEFEGLAGIPQKQSNVFWTKIGQSLYLYKGSSVSAYGTLNLFYNRRPIKATGDSDYIDISDKFADLAIQKAKARVYEVTNQVPPESLTSSINQQIQNVRKANMDEMNLVKSTKSKNN